MGDFNSVFSAAAALSVDDRLRLIDALAAGVPDDHPPSLSAEWIAEINRRAAEIDSGHVSTTPWETVRSSLFTKVGRTRAD